MSKLAGVSEANMPPISDGRSLANFEHLKNASTIGEHSLLCRPSPQGGETFLTCQKDVFYIPTYRKENVY